MRPIFILLLIAGTVVAGCVVEEPARQGYRDDARYRDRDDGRYERNRDRDRDGVPDRQDRRPDDPRRY